jgi:hypothetical protein
VDKFSNQRGYNDVFSIEKWIWAGVVIIIIAVVGAGLLFYLKKLKYYAGIFVHFRFFRQKIGRHRLF